MREKTRPQLVPISQVAAETKIGLAMAGMQLWHFRQLESQSRVLRSVAMLHTGLHGKSESERARARGRDEDGPVNLVFGNKVCLFVVKLERMLNLGFE